MMQKTVQYFQPDFQKIEDVDTGIAYWRIELELDEEEGTWLVVESPELVHALKDFANQLLENYR
ncbi:MAG: hypothetical protein ACK5XN_21900 [Bacteroidota bacterium]